MSGVLPAEQNVYFSLLFYTSVLIFALPGSFLDRFFFGNFVDLSRIGMGFSGDGSSLARSENEPSIEIKPAASCILRGMSRNASYSATRWSGNMARAGGTTVR